MEGLRPSKFSHFSPYIYLIPAFTLYLFANLGPVIATSILSFFKWDSFFPTREFAGIQNYTYILKDPLFWGSLKNNMIFLSMAVVIPVSLGFILAVLIADLNKGKTFYRTVLFLPCIFSGVVIAFTWKWIYHPFVGILNNFLNVIGLSALEQSWLGNPKLALYSCFAAYAWGTIGYSLVIYLSGLQNIENDIYEAAEIEGANFFQRLFRITIPMLNETTTFIISLRILSSMGIFDIIYNLTGGGPYYASSVISIYSYNMLNNAQMGLGSAAVTVNAVITIGISVIFIRWRERRT